MNKICCAQFNPLTQQRGGSIPRWESKCCFKSPRLFGKRVESFYSLTRVNSRVVVKKCSSLNGHVGEAERDSGTTRIKLTRSAACDVSSPRTHVSYVMLRGIFFDRSRCRSPNPSNQHITFLRCFHDDYCARTENISVRTPNGLRDRGSLGADRRSDQVDLSRLQRSPISPSLCGDRFSGGRVRYARRGHVFTSSL